MKVDVAIVGGGPVGGSMARALAPSGLSVALVEQRGARVLPAEGFDRRVYALNRRSQRFLQDAGIWPHLLPERLAPVRDMRVFGQDESHIEFSAYRSGVAELATIVEESNLQQAVQAALSAQADLSLLAGVECVGVRFGEEQAVLDLSDGAHLEASLVVAADGAESAVRRAAGIAVKVQEYGQTGVVANFRSEQPHRDTAYQWFLEHGVLALLPLPGSHVSMVWSAPETYAQELLATEAQDLGRRVARASRDLLGRLEPVSAAAGFALRRMRASRLIARRLALVGDTAHNVHPLAGQGLNLGLGDAQALAGTLAERGIERDCGAHALLRRYERGRQEALLTMAMVTDGLHGLFEADLPGARRLRNVGLNLVNRIGPLKRLLVKRALG
jgi:2-polyprenylphenol 6-hydroxylase